MLPKPPEVPHLMQTQAGWALVPTLSGGSKDDSAWEQETPICVTESTWPGSQEVLCGIGQGWCQKQLRRASNLTPILQAGKMRPREYLGAQPHDMIMCGKLERIRVQESNQKQWKGRILECQTEDPQKPFQRTHFTDRETEAPRGQ